VIATLHALRAFGVRISMEISARAILRAIVSLGIKITAEGVEIESDLAYPKAEGCTEGQGFLFSKATPQAEILALLKETNGSGKQAA
jgi:EAL domain-containing protein (putative c-di-GMP-specific phosphodiesterase class I)